jgi:hypothetical protein
MSRSCLGKMRGGGKVADEVPQRQVSSLTMKRYDVAYFELLDV